MALIFTLALLACVSAVRSHVIPTYSGSDHHHDEAALLDQSAHDTSQAHHALGYARPLMANGPVIPVPVPVPGSYAAFYRDLYASHHPPPAPKPKTERYTLSEDVGVNSGSGMTYLNNLLTGVNKNLYGTTGGTRPFNPTNLGTNTGLGFPGANTGTGFGNTGTGFPGDNTGFGSPGFPGGSAGNNIFGPGLTPMALDLGQSSDNPGAPGDGNVGVVINRPGQPGPQPRPQPQPQPSAPLFPFMDQQSSTWVWPDQVVTGSLPSISLGVTNINNQAAASSDLAARDLQQVQDLTSVVGDLQQGQDLTLINGDLQQEQRLLSALQQAQEMTPVVGDLQRGQDLTLINSDLQQEQRLLSALQQAQEMTPLVGDLQQGQDLTLINGDLQQEQRLLSALQQAQEMTPLVGDLQQGQGLTLINSDLQQEQRLLSDLQQAQGLTPLVGDLQRGQDLTSINGDLQQEQRLTSDLQQAQGMTPLVGDLQQGQDVALVTGDLQPSGDVLVVPGDVTQDQRAVVTNLNVQSPVAVLVPGSEQGAVSRDLQGRRGVSRFLQRG